MSNYKGSNRCILEFISSPDFIANTNALINSAGANISSTDVWIPKGVHNPVEAELKDFLALTHSAKLGADIQDWWLEVYKPGTLTPNWDLVSTCTINGTKGILLVEAKAHESELESAGKSFDQKDSDNSKANHTQIGNAIAQAKSEINTAGYAVDISRDKCYQLSNRVAHAWWLANQGIPVVLLYLGFLDAHDMKDKYDVFKNHKHWEDCFDNHAKKVSVDIIKNIPVNCGRSSFITIVKSVL